MPIVENYEPNHCFETPEPTCKPGYTGYLPDFGPRRLFRFGETFGKITHNIMKSHPVAGMRMGNILDNSQEIQERLEEDALVWKHEVTHQNNRFRNIMVAGYTGYVPRRKFVQGKSFSDDCKQAIALYEKAKMVSDEDFRNGK